ncbi:MAG TPA: HAD-IIIA family hydrolase [Stellaceae bacterium]|nr:HAD-IIIA family hydrolase [Stellaceae bacterium]
MKAAVFLDRDGVLSIPEFRNGRSYAPRRLEKFVIYEDAVAAVDRLKRAGFVVIVVTNQPDVGAGLVSRETVEAMHDLLRATVAVDDIEVCYETRDQATERRKPGAGMLRDAAAKWMIDLSQSFMVGDRVSDIEAGRRAGCMTVFIDRRYSEPGSQGPNTVVVRNLAEAVAWICDTTEGTVKDDGRGAEQ